MAACTVIVCKDREREGGGEKEGQMHESWHASSDGVCVCVLGGVRRRMND